MTTLDLNKHQNAIISAWQSVLNDKDNCDWALFGYDGPSNDLKVISTGKEGLYEIYNEFNPGQVMYAFCRVINPKSNLPVFLTITWIGEGAPQNRKADSPKHSFEIQKFFKYSSLNISARTEDDVEPDVILNQIKKCSSVEYNFTNRIINEEQILPVTTNYTRIKPERDLNLKEKAKFWSKLDEEEKKLKEQKLKKQIEIKKNEISNLNNLKTNLVNENNRKNLFLNKKDEQFISTGINKVKLSNELNEREKFWKLQEEEEKKQLEEESKKKLLEKKTIENEIMKRGISAKNIMNVFNNFSPNKTCVYKINAIDEINLEKKKVLSSLKNSINNKENSELNTQQSKEVNEQFNDINQNDKFFDDSNYSINQDDNIEVNKTFTKEIKKDEILSDNELIEYDVQSEYLRNYNLNLRNQRIREEMEELYDEEYENEYCLDNGTINYGKRYTSKPLSSEPLEDIAEEDEDEQDEDISEFLVGKGKCARALFDYQASDDTEISFDPNDIITNIEQIHECWWHGVGPDKKMGFFPSNYVELLN